MTVLLNLPQTAAQSGELIRAQRLERQRQQRVLSLEQDIAAQSSRVEQSRERLAQAEQRLTYLETSLAELVAAAPPPEGAS